MMLSRREDSLRGVRSLFMRASTPDPLSPVFRLRCLDRLPLHVGRIVGSSAGERSDVIDHVAWTTLRVAGLHFKLVSRRRTPLDPAMGISRNRHHGRCAGMFAFFGPGGFGSAGGF